MRGKKKRPKTIAEYIDAAPKEVRQKLREMRAIVHGAAPTAKEGIKWNMPALSHKRILVMFATFKDHISLFPTGSAVKKFSKELSKFKTSRGTIQFPFGTPLPKALIRKITSFRVRENEEKDGKWRS